MNTKKVYFASPLFTEMEREWNESVVRRIEMQTNMEVYLPQRNMSINDKNAYAGSVDIANGDVDELKSSDILVAVLDGQTIDAGVAAEIGIAYAMDMVIIGLYTDTRTQGADNIKKIEAIKTIGENQFSYINLFVTGLIKKNGRLLSKSSYLIEELKFIENTVI